MSKPKTTELKHCVLCKEKLFACGYCEKHYDEKMNDPIDNYDTEYGPYVPDNHKDKINTL